MGNKGQKVKGKRTPYTLSIEFYQQQVNAGESIRGQAVLRLTDVYESVGGLDKATLTFTGTEKVKQCAQKSD